MRITEKFLETKVENLNNLTKSPVSTYTKLKNGKLKANDKNFYLDFAYGGVALHRMMESGGSQDIFSCGHVTKSDLAIRIDAFISGLREYEK